MLLSGSRCVRVQLAGADQAAVLAADADRQRAGAGDQAGDVFVDGAGQHHLHHLDHRRVGDAQAVDEGGLDGEPLQHRVDLRAAAMHHHRVDADLLQQGDVAGELLGEAFLAHGVAAVFHHDGGAGIAAQERQRLGEHARPLGGGGEVGRRGGWSVVHGRACTALRGRGSSSQNPMRPPGRNPTHRRSCCTQSCCTQSSLHTVSAGRAATALRRLEVPRAA